jgi:hypothetical protein
MMNWKGCDLILCIIPEFAWRDWGQPQSGYPVSVPRFECGTSRIRNSSVTVILNYLIINLIPRWSVLTLFFALEFRMFYIHVVFTCSGLKLCVFGYQISITNTYIPMNQNKGKCMQNQFTAIHSLTHAWEGIWAKPSEFHSRHRDRFKGCRHSTLKGRWRSTRV